MSFADSRLKITEIFYSIQGESASIGIPTVFIRLTGCPLRCTWCDTEYAFTGGEWMAVQAILHQVAAYRAQHVTVTGGEPLAQKHCHALLVALCNEGYVVSLETSGALDIATLDKRVICVMDIKPPSSGESGKNRYSNIDHLTMKDQIKFVIGNREDYEWARQEICDRALAEHCQVLFSPVIQPSFAIPNLLATQLAEWVLQDQLPVRFQIQLHKLLWGHAPGR